MLSKLRRSLSNPLVHCLALGFAAAWLLAAMSPADPIRLDEARLLALERSWQAQVGRPLAAEERARLVEEAATEEALYREALARRFDGLPVVKQRLIQLAQFLELTPEGADPDELYSASLELGLDRSDPMVRRYMVGTLRQKLAREAEIELRAVSQQEIRAFYGEQHDRFREPRRVRLSHVYIGGLDEAARERAAGAAAALESHEEDLDAAVGEGDVFYGGHHLPLMDAQQLAARLGPSFSAAAIGLEPGSWSAPIASSYGYHLVRVLEVKDVRDPPLAEVEERIRTELARERAAAALDARIEALRASYRIERLHGVDGAELSEPAECSPSGVEG